MRDNYDFHAEALITSTQHCSVSSMIKLERAMCEDGWLRRNNQMRCCTVKVNHCHTRKLCSPRNVYGEHWMDWLKAKKLVLLPSECKWNPERQD